MNRVKSDQAALSDILNATNDGVFVLDASRRFVFFNPACERLTGWSAAEVLGTGCQCSQVTHCHDEHGRSLAGLLCPGLGVFEGRQPALRQRMQITTRSGDTRWVETQYTCVSSGNGQPRCVIGVMRDDSDARDREQQWSETAEDLKAEIARLREELRQRYGFAGILTRSPLMQTVLAKIDAACSTTSPVLISGEAGTGKEMIARTIHENSPRHAGPFVVAGAGTIARERADMELFGYARNGTQTADAGSLYATAEGGTLFFDDIELLPPGTQLRLLRVLQDRAISPPGGAPARPVNVRLIAATRRPIQELLTSGALRQDLYYRLGAITIEVPALQARREDIPLLVRHFVDQLNEHSTRKLQEIDPGVWETLDAYHWPGNIRELYGIVEAAFASAREGRLRPEDFVFAPRIKASAPAGGELLPLDERLAEIEKRTILAAIRQAGGQRNLAARLMGISRSRLYRRMEALGIDPDDNEA